LSFLEATCANVIYNTSTISYIAVLVAGRNMTLQDRQCL